MSTQLLKQNKSTSEKYRHETQQRLAEDNTINCLINCYIREYALVQNQVEFDSNRYDAPTTFKFQVAGGFKCTRITFPESNCLLMMKVEQVSLLGRIKILNRPYLKQQGQAWKPINALNLTEFILQHLALVMKNDVNLELLNQVKNSINITRLFIDKINSDNKNGIKHVYEHSPYTSLIKSEQSLLWGHAFHPAPKSRDGISFDQLLSYSPEVQTKFPLYWFKISSHLLKQMYCDEIPPLDAISKINPTDELLYPCHPWEVKTILKQPLIQKAIKLGLISEVGELGEDNYPTSSVRTIFIPKTNIFMKFSIHVRLTNCVRKNAWYELESAVFLTNLIRKSSSLVLTHCPKFSVMNESSATTLDLSSIANDNDQANIQEVIECFGILYRDGITEEEQMKYQPQMAAALFAWDKGGESLCAKLIQDLAVEHEQSYSTFAIQWFNQYLDALLPGVFHYFFSLGIIFEPHLQNTVIGFENGLPAHIWIRDLEGTKLMESHWSSDKLSGLSQKARSSVYYSRSKGWKRIAYCTLINNISEAIFHISSKQESLEPQLWSSLANAIELWQSKESRQPELESILKGDPIPSKNNLTTRLLKHADSLSSYCELKNPILNLLVKS